MIIGKTTETLLAAIRDVMSRWLNGKQVVGSSQAIALSASTPSTLTVPVGATEAWIQVEGASPSATVTSARYTLDGSTPVTGVTGVVGEVGMPLYNAAGQPLVLKGNGNLLAFKAIMATGTQQILKVTYFK